MEEYRLAMRSFRALCEQFSTTRPMRNFLTLTSASVLLVATAAAQAPDVIHYNFDAGDATNTAVPGVGNGTPNAGVLFGAGPCGTGAATSDGTSMIDSGWQVDLGTSSFTIGMTIDLSGGGNAFQYYFGSSSTGGMRCFGNGAAGVDGLMLRTLAGADATLTNVPNNAPAHCVWSYDSVLQQVDGYVDGVLNISVAMPNPINYIGTAADFNVMTYTTTEMLNGNTMDDFRVYRRALSAGEVASWATECGGGGGIGTNYCGPGVANSTGNPGVMSATGSAFVASNDLTLVASDLPNNAFGFFLTSTTQGMVMNPGGSMGHLCLGGAIGRYVGPGQIQNSGGTGEISLLVDLNMHPTPNGLIMVNAGETWNFQAWHRDSVGGNAVSNFTDGLEITFQ